MFNIEDLRIGDIVEVMLYARQIRGKITLISKYGIPEDESYLNDDVVKGYFEWEVSSEHIRYTYPDTRFKTYMQWVVNNPQKYNNLKY